MRPVLVILAVSLAMVGCGKKRILAEAGSISALAHESRSLALEIGEISVNPEVLARADLIVRDQGEIIDRALRVTLATVDVEDRSAGISAWWGDLFMGTVENVKWVAIAAGLAVIGFIGYRARVWTLLGKIIGRG